MCAIDKHAVREIEVFRSFAQVPGLPIDLDSISKRDPPEPDILCSLDSFGPVAFEMVRIIDEEDFGRPHGIQYNLMDALRDGFRNLSERTRHSLKENLGNALVSVGFHRDHSLQKQRNFVPSVLEALNDLGADFEGEHELAGKLKGMVSLRVLRCVIDGPFFDVMTGGAIDPAPLGAVQRKFQKAYATAAPIELLAYYDEQPAPPDFALGSLAAFLDAQTPTSRFRRAWLFDFSKRKVLNSTQIS
jgi:hypothetical protein